MKKCSKMSMMGGYMCRSMRMCRFVLFPVRSS